MNSDGMDYGELSIFALNTVERAQKAEAKVELLTKTLASLISVYSKPDGYGRCTTINVLHEDLKNAVKVLKEVKNG